MVVFTTRYDGVTLDSVCVAVSGNAALYVVRYIRREYGTVVVESTTRYHRDIDLSTIMRYGCMLWHSSHGLASSCSNNADVVVVVYGIHDEV